MDGARNAVGDGWDYDGSRPDFGINVRWGVTQTLTLNGTVNPDFSQVESDAGQFQFDPRQALFFPDKRPFFLDGIEQFATPNNLIYTRRVVAPLAAAKLTGRVAAPHQRGLSVGGGRSVAVGHRRSTIRCSTSCGRSATSAPRRSSAFVYTDRIDGAALEPRRSACDTRLVWKEIYSLLLQGAASRTDTRHRQRSSRRCGRPPSTAPAAATACAPRPAASIPTSEAQSGFISRRGIAHARPHQPADRPTARPGGWFERFTSDVVLDGTWVYDELRWPAGRRRTASCTSTRTWRCAAAGASAARCWSSRSATTRRSTATTSWPQPTADGGTRFVPYVGTPRLPNLDYVVSFTVPTRKGLTADALMLWGKDENFFEWSSADIVFANVGATGGPPTSCASRAATSCSRSSGAPTARYVGHPPHSAPEGRVPGDAADLRAGRRRAERQLRRTRCATTRAPTCRSSSATPPGGYAPALRDLDATRCGSTGCSRTSRRRARCSSPATAAAWSPTLDERRRAVSYRRTSDGFFAKISPISSACSIVRRRARRRRPLRFAVERSMPHSQGRFRVHVRSSVASVCSACPARSHARARRSTPRPGAGPAAAASAARLDRLDRRRPRDHERQLRHLHRQRRLRRAARPRHQRRVQVAPGCYLRGASDGDVERRPLAAPTPASTTGCRRGCRPSA